MLRCLQVAKKEKINYDSLNFSFLKFKVFSLTVFLAPAVSEHGMNKRHLVHFEKLQFIWTHSSPQDDPEAIAGVVVETK